MLEVTARDIRAKNTRWIYKATEGTWPRAKGLPNYHTAQIFGGKEEEKKMRCKQRALQHINILQGCNPLEYYLYF